MLQDLKKILIDEKSLQKRLAEMGSEITRFYQSRGVQELIVICITNGSIIFAADLIRRIDLHVKLDSVRVTSYRGETAPVAEPEILNAIRLNIQNKHVLILDDILDTGHTLAKVKAALTAQGPATLKIAVLLDKKERRKVPMEADFIGFDIPNEFVIGYGLDFNERYRNLPCIGILKPEIISNSSI